MNVGKYLRRFGRKVDRAWVMSPLTRFYLIEADQLIECDNDSLPGMTRKEVTNGVQ